MLINKNAWKVLDKCIESFRPEKLASCRTISKLVVDFVATYIYMDQSSLFRKQWCPLHQVPPLDVGIFPESSSW